MTTLARTSVILLLTFFSPSSSLPHLIFNLIDDFGELGGADSASGADPRARQQRYLTAAPEAVNTVVPGDV